MGQRISRQIFVNEATRIAPIDCAELHGMNGWCLKRKNSCNSNIGNKWGGEKGSILHRSAITTHGWPMLESLETPKIVHSRWGMSSIKCEKQTATKGRDFWQSAVRAAWRRLPSWPNGTMTAVLRRSRVFKARVATVSGALSRWRTMPCETGYTKPRGQGINVPFVQRWADTNWVMLYEIMAIIIHRQLTEHLFWECSNLPDAIYTARWKFAAKSYGCASSEAAGRISLGGAQHDRDLRFGWSRSAEAPSDALMNDGWRWPAVCLTLPCTAGGRRFGKPRWAPFTPSRSSLTNTD